MESATSYGSLATLGAGALSFATGHPIAATILLLVAMVLYFLFRLLQTKSVVDLITTWGASHDEKIEALTKQVGDLTKRIEQTSCANAPGCPNRKL